MGFSKSLFSLANTNNGIFKSAEQASFLLNQCQEEGSYFGGNGSCYGHSFFFEFSFDSEGLCKITKHTKMQSKITWERMDESTFWAEYNATQYAKAERRELITWINKAGPMVIRLKAKSLSKFMTMLAGVTDPIEIARVAKLF